MTVQLLQGDCLTLMRDLPDRSVDMILCDPPYGTTAIEWDRPLDLVRMWEQYKRIIKDNGAIILFSSQPFTTDLITSNRKMFRYEIIWEKTMKSGFLNAKKMPLRIHENLLVFYKKLPTYNPQKFAVNTNGVGRTRRQSFHTKMDQYNDYEKTDWSYTDTGQRFPVDVVKFSNWNGALFGKTENAVKHPTQKPVDLLEYLILTYTHPGDVVLDNCMGSGMTGIACVKTGRKFIGMEIKPEYFSLAQGGIREAQMQPSLFGAQQSAAIPTD
jgi:site-specific DNA-methyltransferase (adenine-specific)